MPAAAASIAQSTNAPEGITAAEMRALRKRLAAILPGYGAGSEVVEGLAGGTSRIAIIEPIAASPLPTFRLDRTRAGLEATTLHDDDYDVRGPFKTPEAAVDAIHAEVSELLASWGMVPTLAVVKPMPGERATAAAMGAVALPI